MKNHKSKIGRLTVEVLDVILTKYWKLSKFTVVLTKLKPTQTFFYSHLGKSKLTL